MAVLLAEAVRTLGVNGPMEWYPTHLILLFVSHSFIKDQVEVLANVDNAMTYCRGRGGGWVLPYISHTGTGMCPPPPPRVGFLGRFGLKTSIYTLPILVWNRVSEESGMVR